MPHPKYEFIVHRIQRLSLLRHIVLRRCVKDLNVHIQQIPIMSYILDNEECIQRDVADSLSISPQSVAQSTKRLQRAGYIQKDVDADNLRRNRLTLTDSGKALITECNRRIDEFDAAMCKGLSREDIEVFCTVLDKMIANISSDDLQGLTIPELRELSNANTRKSDYRLMLNGQDKQETND